MLCSLKISCIKYDTPGVIELSGFLKLLDIFGHFIHVDFSSLNNYILWTLTFFFLTYLYINHLKISQHVKLESLKQNENIIFHTISKIKGKMTKVIFVYIYYRLCLDYSDFGKHLVSLYQKKTKFVFQQISLKYNLNEGKKTKCHLLHSGRE